MGNPDLHWDRAAKLVRDRREDLGLTQQDLALKSDTSVPTIHSLERQHRTTFTRAKLRAVSQALEWTPDSIHRILDGLEPVPVEEARPEDLTYDQKMAELDRRLAKVEAWQRQQDEGEHEGEDESRRAG